MAELLPEDDAAPSAPPTGLAGLLGRVMTWWALAGGFVFCALVIMSIISIVGRKLFASPVEGDMEMLQMGAAIGSAAFLPLCEWQDHHIKVDALTTWMSERARAALDALAHGLLAALSALLAWRTTLYVLEAHENMEVSTLLLVPLWQPVLLIVPSFVLLALAAAWRFMLSVQTARGVPS